MQLLTGCLKFFSLPQIILLIFMVSQGSGKRNSDYFADSTSRRSAGSFHGSQDGTAYSLEDAYDISNLKRDVQELKRDVEFLKVENEKLMEIQRRLNELLRMRDRALFNSELTDEWRKPEDYGWRLEEEHERNYGIGQRRGGFGGVYGKKWILRDEIDAELRDEKTKLEEERGKLEEERRILDAEKSLIENDKKIKELKKELEYLRETIYERGASLAVMNKVDTSNLEPDEEAVFSNKKHKVKKTIDDMKLEEEEKN